MDIVAGYDEARNCWALEDIDLEHLDVEHLEDLTLDIEVVECPGNLWETHVEGPLPEGRDTEVIDRCHLEKLINAARQSPRGLFRNAA